MHRMNEALKAGWQLLLVQPHCPESSRMIMDGVDPIGQETTQHTTLLGT
jgi:hypothetical protein